MNHIELKTAADQIDGYLLNLGMPPQTLQEAFNKAQLECIANMSQALKNVEGLQFEQFCIQTKRTKQASVEAEASRLGGGPKAGGFVSQQATLAGIEAHLNVNTNNAEVKAELVDPPAEAVKPRVLAAFSGCVAEANSDDDMYVFDWKSDEIATKTYPDGLRAARRILIAAAEELELRYEPRRLEVTRAETSCDSHASKMNQAMRIAQRKACLLRSQAMRVEALYRYPTLYQSANSAAIQEWKDNSTEPKAWNACCSKDSDQYRPKPQTRAMAGQDAAVTFPNH